MPGRFSIEDFSFELPQNLIAQSPMRPRDASRLLGVDTDFTDGVVADLPDLLRPGDMLVLNDTKVIPARLFGNRGQARIEVTLNQHVTDNFWRVFAKPGRRLRIGDIVEFGDDFKAHVTEKLTGGEIVLNFEAEDFARALRTHGAMPLPPYINRLPAPTESDFVDYQTIYAAKDGAIAAPTPGLHFTERLFDALAARGIERTNVTLHVGAGTFLPVRSNTPEDHVMHAERGEISPQAARRINQAKDAGGRIIAVGTTGLRVLESAVDTFGVIQPFNDETSLFILPGYKFKAVDMLLTNFHLPRSTLFMLVSAFAGLERMQAAYRHAIEQKYRFYSYGDACLLHRAP
ncbi:MAG: tRNA preQ1(34) S-adenosylmethionine ribosyltransferase-isomerase QueA [Proteobacteria bacterium]|nr:tRNA preQ1(34) S-adenosylmethionine ribosyltransferase-isomerase QueA [Pseudomonadota bacterium]